MSKRFPLAIAPLYFSSASCPSFAISTSWPSASSNSRLRFWIDLVFNSAGIGDDLVPVHVQDPERWQRVVDERTPRGTDPCLPGGRPPHGGAPLRLDRRTCPPSSDSAPFPVAPRMAWPRPASSTSTKTLACEWGPLASASNCIAPAYTPHADGPFFAGAQDIDPAVIERRTPLGRLAEPEEMARAAAFLLSDWASYMTGGNPPRRRRLEHLRRGRRRRQGSPVPSLRLLLFAGGTR